MKKQAIPLAPTAPELWLPAIDAWRNFVSSYPQLCLAESRLACSRFFSVHFDALHKAGVALHIGRKYVAHRDRFNDAAFRILGGLPLEEREAA